MKSLRCYNADRRKTWTLEVKPNSPLRYYQLSIRIPHPHFMLRLFFMASCFCMCAFGENISHTYYTTNEDITRQEASDAIDHLLRQMDEIPLKGKPRSSAYESQLHQRRKCIESFAMAQSGSMLSEIILTISRSETPDDREIFVLSHLLLYVDKEDMLRILKKMYHIPTGIGYTPFSAYLYHIGITQEELNSILDEPNLHPSAIASIAIMVHQYKFGVLLMGHPLTGKKTINEAADLLYGKKHRNK